MGDDLHISGVSFVRKPVFRDRRGEVRQFVVASEVGRIGEVYFSLVLPGVIKGYHLHKKMTLRYTCVLGEVLVGLADSRPESPTFGETMAWPLMDCGEQHGVLTVPPGVWNAFRVLTSGPMTRAAIICNAASHRHTKSETLRAKITDIGIDILGPRFQVSG